MRRMLDPKEVGGSSTIYMHCIQIYGKGFGNVYTVCYNTNPEPFTMQSFQKFMIGKSLPCTGKISVNGVAKPRILDLEYTNYVEVWYYDLDNPSGYLSVGIKQANIQDKVSPL